MIWNWPFAWQILPIILRGMVITVEATVLGMLLALVLGLIWAGLLLLPNRWIFWPTRAVTEFIRDTPLLIQLFFCYYVLPEVGITIPALVTGITVLGINYSAYTPRFTAPACRTFRAANGMPPRPSISTPGKHSAASSCLKPCHQLFPPWEIISSRCSKTPPFSRPSPSWKCLTAP